MITEDIHDNDDAIYDNSINDNDKVDNQMILAVHLSLSNEWDFVDFQLHNLPVLEFWHV